VKGGYPPRSGLVQLLFYVPLPSVAATRSRITICLLGYHPLDGIPEKPGVLPSVTLPG